MTNRIEDHARLTGNDVLLAELGERIAFARRRHRYRQSDLAERAECSRATVQAIEQGKLTYSVGHLLAVLWVLGLSQTVGLVANPLFDEVGLTIDLTNSGNRLRLRTKVDNDF
jgi:transcriptional regulator with XRE-family HTH domain